MADAIAFLPGWGFNKSVWQCVLDKIQQPCAQAYNLPTPVINDNILTIAQKLNTYLPDNSTIVGWSLGGLLGIALCHAFPTKYKKLILVSSTPRFCNDDNWLGIQTEQRDAFLQLAHHDFDKLMKRFLHLVCYPETNRHIHDYLHLHLLPNTEMWHFYLRLLFETDLRNEFITLSIPTLQIIGSRDAIVATNADCHIIDGAGHGLLISHTEYILQQLQGSIC